MDGKISASIMCADLLNLENDIRKLEDAKVEYLHFDIMDGNFVPNITLGPDLPKRIRSITNIPFDIHLMINRPELHLHLFDFREDDIVSVHLESTVHLHRNLQTIRSMGAKPAVALNPATPIYSIEYILDDIDVLLIMTVNPGFAGQKLVPSTISKISKAKRFIAEKGYSNIEIEVDGNVSFENAIIMNRAGANIYVAGSSGLFIKNSDLVITAEKLRKCIKHNVK